MSILSRDFYRIPRVFIFDIFRCDQISFHITGRDPVITEHQCRCRGIMDTVADPGVCQEVLCKIPLSGIGIGCRAVSQVLFQIGTDPADRCIVIGMPLFPVSTVPQFFAEQGFQCTGQLRILAVHKCVVITLIITVGIPFIPGKCLIDPCPQHRKIFYQVSICLIVIVSCSKESFCF